MRNFSPLFFAAFALLGFEIVFGQTSCGPLTYTIPSSTTTFNVGAIGTEGTLNDTLEECEDSSLVITLDYQGDTLRLSNDILVTGRPSNSTTTLVGKGKSGGPLVVVEPSAGDPTLIEVRQLNKTIISNFSFVRRAINSDRHSVIITGKGSMVRDCQFFTADKDESNTGALLFINVEEVLVERCLFRALPNGKGRSIAISAGAPNQAPPALPTAATRNEYRSNIFYSTGLYLTNGTFHIFANTFAGSRDNYNPIIIGSGVGSPGQAVNIQHNLFALKSDELPPIHFAGNVSSSDSILKNAYSRSRTTIPIAVYGSGTAVTLNNTAGTNANVVLPRGFSKYGPSAGEFREYPLVQLRSDSTLSRSHADFGKIPKVFNNTISHWTSMPDISAGLPTNKLYFQSAPFTPFIQGGTWNTAAGVGIKVGALVDIDNRLPPSPLDSGALGKGLVIVRHPADSTRMKVTNLNFTTGYYDTLVPPSTLKFFFATSQAKLLSNDSSVLRNPATGAEAHIAPRPWLDMDSTLIVPKEVRTGNPIFVKVLHYNGSGQASVIQGGTVPGAAVQVTGIPRFPINDLGKPVLDSTSDTTRGLFVLTVRKLGDEEIQSITLTVLRAGGGTEASQTKPAPAKNANATFDFELPKGQFSFTATPVARVGSADQTGPATAPLGPINSRQIAGDSVYVTARTTGCAGATGASDSPFCTLAEALTELGTGAKKGGVILVRNGATPVVFQDLSIGGADTFAVIITAPIVNGAFDPAHRAIFRGSAGKEALNLTRKNVTLRGFYFEMPQGATTPALTIGANAGGAIVDGCVFRPSTHSTVPGPAVNIEVGGNQEVRLISNLIWGYGAGMRVNSASTGIRILHNTFFNDPAVTPSGMTGILAPGSGLGAVIANNYFSGLATPFDASVAGKSPKLDHNAYTTAPNLHGLTEIGSVDTVPRLGSVDLTKATWTADLKVEIDKVLECGIRSPCYELYAGSSSDSYGPAIATDVLGKSRIGKAEIGAWEGDASALSVRGVLAVDVRPMSSEISGAHNRLPFTITQRTYDPSEVDSIHVWWSTANAADLDGNILQANRRSYPISALSSGTLVDTAEGLRPLTTYYVAAALGKTTGNTRTLGWAFRSSGLTPPERSDKDCGLKAGALCPATGFFVVSNGPWTGKFLTQVKFAQPDSVIVNVPQFTSASEPRMYSDNKVEIFSPLPLIKLGVFATAMNEPGSKQSWTATIGMEEDPGEVLNGKELFILPTSPGGLPTFVPNWRLRRSEGKAWLDIEGTASGTFEYGFGTVVAGTEPGKIAQGNPAAPPTFSFKNLASTSATDTVVLTLKGSGFVTSNPLVMITPIPAGGTNPNPLDGTYPSKSLFVTGGMTDLDESIRLEHFFRHYREAAAADSATPVAAGEPGKPFTLPMLDTVTQFEPVALLPNASLAINADGESQELTVKLPISGRFRESNLHWDKVGKATRSIEVVYTVFDGARIGRSSGFIRTEFSNLYIHITEKREFEEKAWNLFTYPWDEADTGSLARILGKEGWDAGSQRLLKYKGTGAGAGAFTAYDGKNASGITFDSARAVWSGASGFFVPNSLTGVSLDYQPFDFNLAANVWTDFGLPFNFPIKWKDIQAASGGLAGLEVWRYIPKKGNTAPSYERLDGKSVVHPWEGLTAKPAAATKVTFPVLDSSRSTTPLAKLAADVLWSADIHAGNATAIMQLRIGKAGREAAAGEAPDVPGQDFRLGLKRLRPEGAETLSQHIQAGEDWRGHWPLSGSVPKEGIRLSVARNQGETPLYLVELLSRRVIPLAKGAEAAIGQADMQGGDWHLVAGDSRYLEDVLNGLVPMHMMALTNYPNPFAGATLIRYALPETFGKVEFRLRIRDSRGRLVLDKVQRGSNSLRWMWDGRDSRGKEAGSGFYTLTLEAKAPGKATQRAVRRLLKM